MLIYIGRHDGIKLSDLREIGKKYFSSQFDNLMDSLLIDKLIEVKDERLYISGKGKVVIKVVEYSKYDIGNLPQEIIDGYILHTPPLGVGSTSITYRATMKRTDRDVVIKVFKPGILDHINFEDKIKKIINISSSFLIVPFDWGEFTWNSINLKYIVMSYIKGDSISKFFSISERM